MNVKRRVFPTVVFEVMSPAMESIDRRKKLANYRLAQSLEEYVLVAQDRREVTIFRRALGWENEVLTALDTRGEFKSVKQAMTIAAIYEDVLATAPTGPAETSNRREPTWVC